MKPNELNPILLPSPNHGARRPGAPIDHLIIHATALPSLEEALDILRDPKKQVSAHYVIAKNGELYRLVEEDLRAWHAGVSWWRGETDLNSRSIGIELDNEFKDGRWGEFPPPQMKALIALLADLFRRHPVPQRHLLAHSDIAPQRKRDPGEGFDWRGLAQKGFGLFPRPVSLRIPGAAALIEDSRNRRKFFRRLEDYGYDVRTPEAGRASLIAFQRHFRPAGVHGRLDRSTYETLARLTALLKALPPKAAQAATESAELSADRGDARPKA